MSGAEEHAGAVDGGGGLYPLEWGMAPGARFSPVRASWVAAQVRKRSATSGAAAIRWLYSRGYRSVAGQDPPA